MEGRTQEESWWQLEGGSGGGYDQNLLCWFVMKLRKDEYKIRESHGIWSIMRLSNKRELPNYFYVTKMNSLNLKWQEMQLRKDEPELI